jgi:signal recognition particle subunit SRP54
MLGMGDVLSLIEKAEQAIEPDEAEALEARLRKNQFTLDDFGKQLKTLRRMGPLESLLGMIPGLGGMKQLAENKPDEKQLGRIEAILSSMTPAERRNDGLLNGSRRKRVARGSGTTVEDVNRLLKQFGEMKRVLQMMGSGGMAAVAKGMAKGGSRMPQMPPGGFAAGKKKKKGGPWGLIRSR